MREKRCGKVGEALRWGARMLRASKVSSPWRDAELLLSSALGSARHELYMESEEEITEEEDRELRRLIKARARRVPLQYLLGKAEFLGMEVAVSPAVMVPRPETELLVQIALERLAERAPGALIADLGTGSGNIAVALARMGLCQVLACDIWRPALAVARTNARRLGVSNLVTCRLGDFFGALDGIEADMIVSNPPYLAAWEIPFLMPEVARYEPRVALEGGEDGFLYHRLIADRATDYLKPGGYLVSEMGFGQAGRVLELARANPRLEVVQIARDLGNRDRVLVARRRKV